MNHLKMIKESSTVLFPHSHLPESKIKKILPFFGPLRMFVPWFMEPPSLESMNIDGHTVDIKYPPLKMKPSENFKTLLLEYTRWIEDHQDKGYTEYLKAIQEAGLSEDTTWEIRQMIRKENRGDGPLFRTTRWHLILHLAQDMEDQRREADGMLTSLKERGILFKGIIEESDNVRNPVEDLPSFQSESFMPKQHLRQIFEAWFALFGVYLGENDLLLTVNRHFMNYADELWKKPDEENQADGISSLQFELPDFSHLFSEELSEMKRTSSEDDTFGELKDLLLNFGEDPTHNFLKLEKLKAKLERLYPLGNSRNDLRMTIKYLPAFPDAEHYESDILSRYLENRMIILLED